MNIGEAMEAIKRGERVARVGWNGRDMWIAYSPGRLGLNAHCFWSPANLMGWLASQTDLLALDWCIVN